MRNITLNIILTRLQIILTGLQYKYIRLNFRQYFFSQYIPEITILNRIDIEPEYLPFRRALIHQFNSLFLAIIR